MIEMVKEMLQLPPQAYIDRSVPKSFFNRNFQLTASEKRLLNIPFLPIRSSWIAELNTKTLNIPSVESTKESYTRIPVFVVEFSAEHWETQLQKTIDLYHKYIQFPVLLFAHTTDQFVLSAGTKSINQADKGRRVVERQYTTPKISLLLEEEHREQFQQHLAFPQLNRIDLKTMYDSYIAAIVNYRRAIQVGNFKERKDVNVVDEQLNTLQVLEKEMRSLKNKLLKSKRIQERVALQMELQELKKRKTKIEESL